MKRLVRTIEIISYIFGPGAPSMIYSKVKHYEDNTFDGFTKRLTREEVDTHLATGNWHKITGDRAKGDGGPHRLAIQVVEHTTPHVPSLPYKDSSVNTGEDEFSGLGLVPED